MSELEVRSLLEKGVVGANECRKRLNAEKEASIHIRN